MMVSLLTQTKIPLLIVLPRPLVAVLLLLATLVLLGGSIWLAVLLWRYFLQRQQVAHQITLLNHSNLPTVFHLHVNANGLRVTPLWFQGNQAIQPGPVERTSYIEEAAEPLAQGNQERRDIKTEGLSRYRAIRTFTSLIANIAASLSALLPGAFKDFLGGISETIRQGQQAVDAPVNQAKRTADTGAQLKSQVKQLKAQTGQPAPRPASRNEWLQPGQSTGQRPVANESQKQFRSVTHIEQVVKTPVLAPAEQVTYRLELRPHNLLYTSAGNFTVVSQQVENEAFPAYGAIQPQEQSGAYAARSLSLAGKIVLFGVYAGLILVNGLWIGLAIYWITG